MSSVLACMAMMYFLKFGANYVYSSLLELVTDLAVEHESTEAS